MSFLDFFFFIISNFIFFFLGSLVFNHRSLEGGEQQVQGWCWCQFPSSRGQAGPGLNWDIQHHQWLLLTGDRGVNLEL